MHRFVLPTFLLVILAACPSPAPELPGDDDDDATAADDDDATGADDDDDGEPWPEDQGELDATNEAGRHGAYFVPEHQSQERLPVLLLFHATGSDGAAIRDQFVDEARARGFAIVAPDSRVSPSGDYTWEVGTDPGEVTPDLTYAQECFDEVVGDHDFRPHEERTLAAGHSGGASSAPYLATNDDRFTHFGILHGGMFAGAFGDNLARAWLSTGEDDTARPPAELQGYADQLEALGFDVTYELYPGGHGISADERTDLLDWWLAD